MSKFLVPLCLSQASFVAMFELQHKCNQALIHHNYIDPDFQPKNLDFALAARREFMEGFDHLDCKWWKPQPANVAQYAMEMIDVIHFVISGAILINSQRGMTIEEGAKSFHQVVEGFFQDFSEQANSVNAQLNDLIDSGQLTYEEALAGMHTGQLGTFMTGSLVHMMALALLLAQAAGLTTETIYKMYVAKNALNIFRKENGYADGTYIKNWFGQEDNVAVERYLELKDMAEPTAIDDLTAYLNATYATVVASQQ